MLYAAFGQQGLAPIAQMDPKLRRQLERQLDAVWRYGKGKDSKADRAVLEAFTGDLYPSLFDEYADRGFWVGELLNPLIAIYGEAEVEAATGEHYPVLAHAVGWSPPGYGEEID